MSNENGQTNETNQPKMVEVQIGDKKVMVSEEGKDLLMTQADYTRKMQKVAEERKELEGLIAQNHQDINTARNILGVLSENEEAANLMEAILTKDETKLNKIKGKKEDINEVDELRKKIEQLENKINVQSMNMNANEKRKVQMDEARQYFKEKGMDFDKYQEKMVEMGTKNNNPLIPWAVTAASEDMIKAAEERGRLIGKKETLEEFSSKFDNTPIISGGMGVNGKKGISNTREAAEVALKRLQAEKYAS
jgi:hypothetical protein